MAGKSHYAVETEVVSVGYVESVVGSISEEFVGAYDAIASRR